MWSLSVECLSTEPNLIATGDRPLLLGEHSGGGVSQSMGTTDGELSLDDSLSVPVFCVGSIGSLQRWLAGNDGGSPLSSEVIGVTLSPEDSMEECSLSVNSDLCESALSDLCESVLNECAPLLGAGDGRIDSDNAVAVVHSKLSD